jgi:hypothetical protein
MKKPTDVTIYGIEMLGVTGRTIMTPAARGSVRFKNLVSGLLFVRFQISEGIVNGTIIKN